MSNKKSRHQFSLPINFYYRRRWGTLRTGAFTASLLAALQDSFHKFKNDIYAFSTVSGGEPLALVFFNAVNFVQPDSASKYQPKYYRKITRTFFSDDQLSPILAKMFYGDVLNYFWPKHIDQLDRAIALETAWENSYENIFTRTSDPNVYSSDFTNCNSSDSTQPVWLINTTEVESGLQCFISSVKPDSFLFENQRDLLAEKIRGGINYSTAVNFSTRFPLVSPSAALRQNEKRTYHYVDGGYVENTGAKTMLELMQRLKCQLISKNVVPYVIQLKFGSQSGFSSYKVFF